METVRILNDRDSLAEVMSPAGESPEAVLEATYGWYWAARCARRTRRDGASGAPAGGEGVFVSAGHK